MNPLNKTETHTSHCCVVHGCKYSDPECTVQNKTKIQEYLCEDCNDVLTHYASRIEEMQDTLKDITALKENIAANQKLISTPTPTVVYGTPWIEVESGWGNRPSGWKLFVDKQEAKVKTEESNRNGTYNGGYIGPCASCYLL